VQPNPTASNLIVFIVGGATFEEAKEVALSFNNQDVRVIVGGNTIHNSKTFMADISQIQLIKGGMEHFEIE
jgi:vacuolar protein sorting-associated protein 45